MQERVEALEAQLAEREQLVAALTERLEQAAEQLDRLHRTGADRGVRAGIAGVPTELITQQQKLVEDLQRAVEQWEAMQPGEFFGRLESQLGQIHEMVQQIDRSGGDQATDAGTDSAFRYGARKSDGGSSEHDSHRSSEPSHSILDFMKKSQQPEAAEEPPASAFAETAPPAAGPSVIDIALPPLDDPPQPVDPAHATPDELGEACTARDVYITYLLHRLRQIESLGHVPNSWAGLENLPDDQRARLDALEHRLQETCRVAEVELSLQRAKLARDELRVRMLDEQMQKDIKRAKVVSDSHSDDSSDSKGDQSGSRWKRMIGR